MFATADVAEWEAGTGRDDDTNYTHVQCDNCFHESDHIGHTVFFIIQRAGAAAIVVI